MTSSTLAEDEEGLTKVYFDLPDHWLTNGESVWSKPLGDDLFELRNVPFAAYGANNLDVVRAVARKPGLKPQVQAVVRPSGHKTLRAIFNTSDQSTQLVHLKVLESLGAEIERANKTLVALDIPVSVDYQSICSALWSLEQQEVLHYETCEQRLPGSFSVSPENSDAQTPET